MLREPIPVAYGVWEVGVFVCVCVSVMCLVCLVVCVTSTFIVCVE